MLNEWNTTDNNKHMTNASAYVDTKLIMYIIKKISVDQTAEYNILLTIQAYCFALYLLLNILEY